MIDDLHENSGRVITCLLKRENGGLIAGKNNIRLHSHELCRRGAKCLSVAALPAIINLDVAAFKPT